MAQTQLHVNISVSNKQLSGRAQRSCNFLSLYVISILPEDSLLKDESCTRIWVYATNL
jgi:hypothetical protein